MDHEINSHDIKKPFACKNCKSRFSKLSSLKVHDKIHSGKRPFACPFPECGKSFVEKGNMKTHFKTHVILILKIFRKTLIHTLNLSMMIY